MQSEHLTLLVSLLLLLNHSGESAKREYKLKVVVDILELFFVRESGDGQPFLPHPSHPHKMDNRLEAIWLRVKKEGSCLKWPKEQELGTAKIKYLADNIAGAIFKWLNSGRPHTSHTCSFYDLDFALDFFEVEGHPGMDCKGAFIDAAWRLAQDKFKGDKFRISMKEPRLETYWFELNFYIEYIPLG